MNATKVVVLKLKSNFVPNEELNIPHYYCECSLLAHNVYSDREWETLTNYAITQEYERDDINVMNKDCPSVQEKIENGAKILAQTEHMVLVLDTYLRTAKRR